MKKEVNPLTGPIFKNMLKFAIPIMLISLIQTLFSMMDTLIIGRFGSDDSMSAVGVNSSIIYLIIGSVSGISIGISTEFGKCFGEKNENKIIRMHQSIPLTALILGLSIIIIFVPLGKYILKLVNCPNSIIDKAYLYYFIYFISSPFMFLFSFESAVLEAKGDSFHPLLFGLIAAFINTFLNIIFVYFFKWDVFGVAFATFLSQLISALLLLIYLIKDDGVLHLNIKDFKALKNLKDVFKIGIPSAIEIVIMCLSGVIISSAINEFDEIVISGNTAAQSVEGMMSIAFVGFSSASLVFISQNYGNNNYKRILNTFIISNITVLILGELIGTSIYLLGDQIVGLFVNDDNINKTEIIKYGVIRLKYMGVFFGLCGTMNVLSECLRGIGCSKTPLIISFITSCLFRITWVLTIAKDIGTIESIFVSNPICWALTTILMLISFLIFYNIKNNKYKVTLSYEGNI